MSESRADQKTDWSKIVALTVFALVGVLVLLVLLVAWLADGMTAKFHAGPSYAQQLRGEAKGVGDNHIYWLDPSEGHRMDSPAVVTSDYAIVSQPVHIPGRYAVIVHIQTAFPGTSIFSLPVNNDGYNLVILNAPNGEHVLVSSPVGGQAVRQSVLRSLKIVPNS